MNGIVSLFYFLNHKLSSAYNDHLIARNIQKGRVTLHLAFLPRVASLFLVSTVQVPAESFLVQLM